MNRKLLSFLLTVLLVFNISVTAFGVEEGNVTYTSAGTMNQQNFDVNQVYSGLEPGDTRSYTVNIHNANSKTTRWYMSNSVKQSLEESDRNVRYDGVSGGAYTYKLVYVGPRGTQVIYDSQDRDNRAHEYVGGGNLNTEAPFGLHEATSNLENYFFLDTLNSGESGHITLTVALEGETQDNSYQNTQGQIRMNFAVEPNNTNPTNRTAVKTGDENNLIPYYIGMFVAGLLLLYLALDAYTDKKFQKGRVRK